MKKFLLLAFLSFTIAGNALAAHRLADGKYVPNDDTLGALELLTVNEDGNQQTVYVNCAKNPRWPKDTSLKCTDTKAIKLDCDGLMCSDTMQILTNTSFALTWQNQTVLFRWYREYN